VKDLLPSRGFFFSFRDGHGHASTHPLNLFNIFIKKLNEMIFSYHMK